MSGQQIILVVSSELLKDITVLGPNKATMLTQVSMSSPKSELAARKTCHCSSKAVSRGTCLLLAWATEAA